MKNKCVSFPVNAIHLIYFFGHNRTLLLFMLLVPLIWTMIPTELISFWETWTLLGQFDHLIQLCPFPLLGSVLKVVVLIVSVAECLLLQEEKRHATRLTWTVHI